MEEWEKKLCMSVGSWREEEGSEEVVAVSGEKL